MRVQTAQDAATIHELRTCLEQEREGEDHVCPDVFYLRLNFSPGRQR